MAYKEYNHITAEYQGYKGAIYKDNMFGMEFCNASVYDKTGREIFHATLNNERTYTEDDVIKTIKWVIEMLERSNKDGK